MRNAIAFLVFPVRIRDGVFQSTKRPRFDRFQDDVSIYEVITIQTFPCGELILNFVQSLSVKFLLSLRTHAMFSSSFDTYIASGVKAACCDELYRLSTSCERRSLDIKSGFEWCSAA